MDAKESIRISSLPRRRESSDVNLDSCLRGSDAAGL